MHTCMCENCRQKALKAIIRGETSECRIDEDLILLYEGFKSTQEVKYLDVAVELVEKSRAADSLNCILGAEHLVSYLQSLKSGSRVVFLTISISPCILTVNVCGEVEPSIIRSKGPVDTHTLKWDQLEIFLFPGFERLEEADLMEISHNAIQKELSNLPIGHRDRRRLLLHMGLHFYQRYEGSRNPEDLWKSIEYTEEANGIECCSCYYVLPELDDYISDSLHINEDITAVVYLSKLEFSKLPVGHPDREAALERLQINLFHKYKKFGKLLELNNAIKIGEEELAIISIDNPRRWVPLSTLAWLLEARYNHDDIGALEDLDQALELTIEAIKKAPKDDPELYIHEYSRKSRLLKLRYPALLDPQDLEDIAIDQDPGALEEAIPEHYRWASLLALVFKTPKDYEEYARITGRDDDLKDRAFKFLDKHGQSVHFSAMSYHLGKRYEVSESLDDLDNAIEMSIMALEATRLAGDDAAPTLIRLSSQLGSRFDKSSALEDLEKAIMRAKEAVVALDGRSPESLQDILHDLSILLFARYCRLRNLGDLNDSIEYQRQALAMEETITTRTCKDGICCLLRSLAKLLQIRYDRTETTADLEESVSCAERAYAQAHHNTERLRCLLLRSDIFAWKYKRFEEREDLERCLDGYQEYRNYLSTNNDQEYRKNHHHFLEHFSFDLYSLYFVINDPSENLFTAALTASLEAWECTSMHHYEKLRAATRAMALYISREKWEECNNLCEDSIGLFPTLSPRILRRSDQQYLLSEFPSLPALAVSVALKAGSDPAKCLGNLELSRGIIMGLTIDCRNSLSELQERHPEVYTRFHDLRAVVDCQADTEDLTERDRRRRQTSINNLEKLVKLIRELPGFDTFQLPPHANEMRAVASEGPIIILNSTVIRSDAIIVTHSSIKILPLLDLKAEDVSKYMKRLSKSLTKPIPGSYGKRNAGMARILLWLWNTIVEPVFTELGFRLSPTSNDSALPRVWWIGVGPLAMAPFHAAGDHSNGSTKNTLSQAISSYIPTLKALSYAREKKIELFNGDSSLLLVTMPDTSGNDCHLLNTDHEANNITDTLDGTDCSVELLRRPSATEVLKKLETCDAIHFACHGISESKDPSESHLLLYNGSDPQGSVSKLTVGEISRANIKKAQIAYLSACSTVRNDHEGLANESIHIASGFQLAGFSHVLGTLWESDDNACMEISRDFYRLLFAGDNDTTIKKDGGHRHVSLSFHRAVRKLRDDCRNQPLLWAPFIHTGA
ncbi:CHAT domain-containing protein [Morchella snyderi]|nr:CHAT domain-containing protein [Morchella snyderi]